MDEDLRHAARQTPDRCAVGGVEAPGAQDLPPTPGGCGPPCACSACLCMRCALPAHDSCGAGMVLLLVAMPHVHDFGCASQRVRFQPCGLSLPTLERRSPRSPRGRRGAASTPGGRARALRRHAAEAAGGLPEPYRLRAVGHSLGGAALLIYAVMCRKLGRPHHIYRLILLTPAGFLQKLPLVQNPAPDPETPAEAAAGAEACPQPPRLPAEAAAGAACVWRRGLELSCGRARCFFGHIAWLESYKVWSQATSAGNRATHL